MNSDNLAELIINLRKSPFYLQKLSGRTLTSFTDLPFTSKSELVEDQRTHPPYGSDLTHSLSSYTRLHQTSGTTTGHPLRWLDTPESWDWLLDRWDIIYRHVGIRSNDRLLFAFSFGPFLGFWT